MSMSDALNIKDQYVDYFKKVGLQYKDEKKDLYGCTAFVSVPNIPFQGHQNGLELSLSLTFFDVGMQIASDYSWIYWVDGKHDIYESLNNKRYYNEVTALITALNSGITSVWGAFTFSDPSMFGFSSYFLYDGLVSFFSTKGFSKSMIENSINIHMMHFERFADIIMAVATGGIKFNEAIEIIEEKYNFHI